jgi:PAS domain S-box-containing protein
VGVAKVSATLDAMKGALDALRDSEERFRLLVENVRDHAIFMLAPDGTIVSWNAGAERLKGYRADEAVGQHVSRFYTAEDVRAGKPRQALETAEAQGRFEEEGWRVRRDGSRFWADVIITALRDDAGNLRGFGKVARDLTERKRTEDALRESEALYRSLFTLAPSGVVVTDEAGRA